MKPAFERQGGAIRMQLRLEEAALLHRMRDELHAVLEDPNPSDPVDQRLFPPTVRGDVDADAELRDLVHDDLRRTRLAALDDLVGFLDRAERHRGRLVVDLVDEEPAVVLGVLNDVRLALASRVGLDRVEQRELLDDPGSQTTLAVLDWFAMWQEQLLIALDPEAARHYEEGHDLQDGH